MNRVVPYFALLLFFFCISCAQRPTTVKETGELFQAVPENKHIIQALAPVFLVREANEMFNRIGTPKVRLSVDASPEVYVDVAEATFYVDQHEFKTDKGIYSNLVYRLHFSEVPFGAGEVHLGVGKNVGLLIIITLNHEKTPVLLTTVHACGCYLAFFPFDSLPPDSLPEDWPSESQRVYGKTLPTFLKTPDTDRKILITLDGGNHRISGVTVKSIKSLVNYYRKNEVKILPLDSLWRLPFGDKTVSFYELHGPRKGYVKDSQKPLERLLMSWWAFDWRVGEDKVFENNKEIGPTFYTSLKFWRRNDSDMRDFATFLKYWGWRL